MQYVGGLVGNREICIRLPLSPQIKKETDAKFTLASVSFFIWPARRRRQGMSEQSDEIPVRDGSFRPFSFARALPAGTGDVRTE